MTQSELQAYRTGVTALAAIAAASAEILRAKLTEAPTRYNFAIAALDGVVAAGADLVLPAPPNDSAPATGTPI